MNRFLSLIFICIFLISCQPNEVKERSKQVDSLQVVMNKSAETLMALNPEFTAEANGIIEEKLDFIQNNYSDTMNRETAILIGDYTRMRRNLNKLNTTYKSQLTQVDYTKKQLENLKTDVKNQKIGQEEFEVYLNTEKEQIEKISETISNLSTWQENTEKRFGQLDSAINVLISNIKTSS